MSKNLLTKYKIKFKLLFRYYYGMYVRTMTEYLTLLSDNLIKIKKT